GAASADGRQTHMSSVIPRSGWRLAAEPRSSYHPRDRAATVVMDGAGSADWAREQSASLRDGTLQPNRGRGGRPGAFDDDAGRIVGARVVHSLLASAHALILRRPVCRSGGCGRLTVKNARGPVRPAAFIHRTV